MQKFPIEPELRRRGIEPKKATANELNSACPFCQEGTNRFVVFLDKQTYWCRKCGHKGDAIQMVQDLDGLTFKEAVALLGGAPSTDNSPKSQSRKTQQPAPQKVVAEYDYLDEDGVLRYQVQRLEPGDHGRKKKFVQRQPGKNKGAWVRNMKDVDRLLYRLPDIVDSPTVWLVEGEKDADWAHELGLKATTTTGGSDGTGKALKKQQSDYQIFDVLEGKQVLIVPDNDEPGRIHAETAAEILFDIAGQVRIVNIPNQIHKADFFDFVQKVGRDRATPELIELAKAAPIWEPPKKWKTLSEMMTAERVRRPQILGFGVWPVGAAIILAGETGVGKSMFRLLLAIHLAAGIDFLEWKIWKPYRVAIMQYEQTDDSEADRGEAICEGLGLKLDLFENIFFADRTVLYNFMDSHDQSAVTTWIRSTGADIVMYDNLSQIHRGKENSNDDMQIVMDFITQTNAKLGTSSLLLHHYNKGNEQYETSGLGRVRGATAITNAQNTVMTYSRKPHEKKILRQLVFEKVRDGAPRGNKPWLLEGDEKTFLLTKVDDDTLCSPKKVAEILESLGGEVEYKYKLVDAIKSAVDCHDSSASTYIKNALTAKEIEVVSTKGRGKGYRVTGRDDTLLT